MSEDFSQKRAGNYTLVRKLGDGGFATVYLAQHTVLEKKAAVKLLLNEWVEEQDVVTRFFDEARTMESVSEHPNIVKIIDIATKEKCQDEGLPPYFIMEYLEGKSLEDIMKSTDGFTLEQIVKIMDSALSALQFCHDHGVVHRDIKPSNFMLDADGNVKLTDFGIAKAAENTSKTGEGLTLGSTDYMSPEQALGKRDLDYRSDIYSLGVTLYQLVCDRLPFIADSANAVALKHIQEKPVPPIDLNPDVPRRLNNIILKAMEKEKEHRFQSCNEMKEELDKLLDPNIEDVPEEQENSSKTGVRTTTFDLNNLHPNPDDDEYNRDEYDETTNYTGMTTRKLVNKPPVALVGFIRTLLIIAITSLFFLLLFYLYGKFTKVHLKLECNPVGAKVYVNNNLVGTAPYDIDLDPTRFLISFGQDGYATESKLLNSNAGEKLEVNVKLIKIDNEAKAKLNSLKEDFKKSFSNLTKSANSKSKKDQSNHAKYQEEVNQIYDSIEKLFESHTRELEYGLSYIEVSKDLDKLDDVLGKISKLISSEDSANLHCLMSYAYKAKGNKDKYKEELDAAYLLDPNNKNVLNAYGQYFIDLGDKDHAKQFLEMSLFLYPDQPEIKAKNEKL